MDEQAMLAPDADVSELTAAGTFLAGIATQDFARLGEALAPHVRLRALLPGGPKEWAGVAAVADRFARWFGDTVQFDLVESTVGAVGSRTHLRWRLRLQADRLGVGSFVVEQHAYADADERGRIARLDLICSGYLPERFDG
jgi:hypothetical protein